MMYKVNEKLTSPNSIPRKKSIFNEYQKVISYVIVLLWFLVTIDFSIWWFLYNDIVNPYAFLLVSLSVFWLPLIHAYFFFFSLRQREYTDTIRLPEGRLALITTKVPSESNELLIRTLQAMKQQVKLNREFDVWLLDEDPNRELVRWCKTHGVYVITRKGVENYNRSSYPGKAKTKEGNIRYFLDHWGYDRYDFLIQFDADHAPEPDFAYEVMKEFVDPAVGYVATPSIVDGNFHESWTVRARNFWESTTHGPIQSGTYDGFAPLMFGSHYSHRMKALKEIGGIGPEIAEDHTTTLLYNAHGWKGGFARNAIAHGYGAVGITDSMMQEYQWAMVGMRASILVTPMYFRNLSKGVKFQFLIWELWYPLLTIVSMISLLLPVYALFASDVIVKVESEAFLYRYAWINGLFLLFGFWLRYLRHFRPHYSWHVSLETFIFQYLQFPWIVLGWLSGLWQVITKQEPSKIAITDKDSAIKDIHLFSFIPHYCIIAITWIPLIFKPEAEDASGYVFFVLLVMISFVISLLVGTYLSLKENLNKISQQSVKYRYLRRNLPTALSLIVVTLISSFLLGKAIDDYYQISLDSFLTILL